MTALGERHTGSAGSMGTRSLFLGVVFTLAGLAAGFAIGQNVDFSDEPDRTIAAGPLVERSQAMQANIDALIEGGRAQAGALAAAGVIYSGPLVDRSLAMDRFYTTAYEGPLVERSLAMDRQVEALIEGAQAQAAALSHGE